MESCLSVEREHEKVANKLDVVRGTSLSRLQSVIDQVESLKERIRQGDCTTTRMKAYLILCLLSVW